MTGSSSGPISPVRRASSAGQRARMASASVSSKVVGLACSGSVTGGNTGDSKASESSTPNARLVQGSAAAARPLVSPIRGAADLEQSPLHEPFAERREVSLYHIDRLLELGHQQRHGIAHAT